MNSKQMYRNYLKILRNWPIQKRELRFDLHLKAIDYRANPNIYNQVVILANDELEKKYPLQKMKLYLPSAATFQLLDSHVKESLLKKPSPFQIISMLMKGQ